MSAKDISTHFTVAQQKKLQRAKKMGLPMPDVQWGEFNKLRAFHAIQRLLTSHAQHIAWFLALRTPEDGVLEITHREVHEITGRAGETIAAAMKEVERAGVLHGKRTRDVFVYTWGECVYKRPQRAEKIVSVAELSFEDEQHPSDTELDACTVVAYRDAWTERYGVEKTDVQINATGLARIRSRIHDIASRRIRVDETIGAAYRRTSRDAMREWMRRDGIEDSKWLAAQMHPLQCLAEGTNKSRDADLDFVAQAIAKLDKLAHKRETQRNEQEREIRSHVAGPRTGTAHLTNQFAALVPRHVQAGMRAP